MKTLPAEGSRPRTAITLACFQRREESLVLQSLSCPRWLEVHLWTVIFQALDYCKQKGFYVSVPAKVKMVPVWLTLRDGTILPCPSSLFSPPKDAWMWQAFLMAPAMHVWRAAAGQSKWAESVYLPPFIHQVGHCPEPPSLSQSAAGCLWAQHWTKVAAAVSLMSSACPCSSHLLSA